ncbi:hypothetical protein B0H13DRAFT_1867188 [Mycena leptocephala]|nr:hypothetical protein B0H13DRAFT_1867188 [Mycena leptocephala]
MSSQAERSSSMSLRQSRAVPLVGLQALLRVMDEALRYMYIRALKTAGAQNLSVEDMCTVHARNHVFAPSTVGEGRRGRERWITMKGQESTCSIGDAERSAQPLGTPAMVYLVLGMREGCHAWGEERTGGRSRTTAACTGAAGGAARRTKEGGSAVSSVCGRTALEDGRTAGGRVPIVIRGARRAWAATGGEGWAEESSACAGTRGRDGSGVYRHAVAWRIRRGCSGAVFGGRGSGLVSRDTWRRLCCSVAGTEGANAERLVTEEVGQNKVGHRGREWDWAVNCRVYEAQHWGWTTGSAAAAR